MIWRRVEISHWAKNVRFVCDVFFERTHLRDAVAAGRMHSVYDRRNVSGMSSKGINAFVVCRNAGRNSLSDGENERHEYENGPGRQPQYSRHNRVNNGRKLNQSPCTPCRKNRGGRSGPSSDTGEIFAPQVCFRGTPIDDLT